MREPVASEKNFLHPVSNIHKLLGKFASDLGNVPIRLLF
jgi:hypothetical protein